MPKIDIISGFLGAGKTTLIKKLLPSVYQNKKIVLVENEFGEIGIDGSFLKESGVIINEINSGCICCTLKGDFKKALQQVIDTYQPDIILIEPSGVGKLSDILNIIKSIEKLTIQVQSTVVDANRALTYQRNFGAFFNDQIQNANCIILSRTQDINQEKLDAVLKMLKKINKHAHIITTNWENISAETIYNTMISSHSLTNIIQQEIAKAEISDNCCCHCHDDHCHEHTETHHHCDADEVFQSIGLETGRKYSPEELEHALEQLPENVIRAKGIVQDQQENWFFFDYVPGSIDVRKGKASYTGLITIIGTNIDSAKMKSIFGVN